MSDPLLRFRDRFPILETTTYLVSNSLGAMPRSVAERLAEYAREWATRGVRAWAERWWEMPVAVGDEIAPLIGAGAGETAMVPNVSMAQAQVLSALDYSPPRDTIVMTALDFPSVRYVYDALAARLGARIVVVPSDDGIGVSEERLIAAIDERTRLVAMSHVLFRSAYVMDVARVAAHAHAMGALVSLDAYHSVGVLPVDVQALGADFYVFSGHKMLAPTGSGALWARRELLEAMPPFLAGGEMIREVHLRRSDWNDIPWKFEAGTPDIAAQIGMGAAADYLMTLGMGRVREHERDLLEYTLEVLPREIPDLALYGPLDANLRGGVVPFNVPGVHPHDVAQVLDRYGIAVRAGHHCTMPLHERLDLAATARASFNVYTTRADIDALVAGLKEVERLFAA
jgi:selenocysteine lyase/cysteine desulfurase